MKHDDLIWLAGLLEGEGSFMCGPPSEPNRPLISLQMTDKDVVQRAAEIMGLNYIHKGQDPRGHWKTTYAIRLRGRRAVALMRQLFPLMGMRRQKQIQRAVDSHVPSSPGDVTRKLTEEQVRNIRDRINRAQRFGGEQATITSLAKEFNVSRDTIKKIRDRETWKWVA